MTEKREKRRFTDLIKYLKKYVYTHKIMLHTLIDIKLAIFVKGRFFTKYYYNMGTSHMWNSQDLIHSK